MNFFHATIVFREFGTNYTQHLYYVRYLVKNYQKKKIMNKILYS